MLQLQSLLYYLNSYKFQWHFNSIFMNPRPSVFIFSLKTFNVGLKSIKKLRRKLFWFSNVPSDIKKYQQNHKDASSCNSRMIPYKKIWLVSNQWVCSFGVIRIRIRISDPRSLRSWCIRGTGESTLVTDSSVRLMHHDPNDPGSLILIQIIPKKCIQSVNHFSQTMCQLHCIKKMPRPLKTNQTWYLLELHLQVSNATWCYPVLELAVAHVSGKVRLQSQDLSGRYVGTCQNNLYCQSEVHCGRS